MRVLITGAGGQVGTELVAAFAADAHHEVIGVVAMHAGDIGIAAFDPVSEPVLDQEIERAIHRDRCVPRAMLFRRAVDDLVGAERLVVFQQRLEHLPACRRQLLCALIAQRFRITKRVDAAAIVVVIRRGEDRASHASLI